MGFAPNVTREIDRFLQDYCPNPDLIRDALLRTGLCSVLDCLPEELVCRRGDRVGGCWLILAGWVEVRSDEQNVTFREAGELIGEQGLLHFLSGKDRSRTADIRANGAARLLCIDAAFQENLQDHEKVAWMQTLATVVNNKLEQATRARSDLRSSASEHELLLRRFSDGDALGLVKISASGETPPVQSRRAIVYFSDLANFSTWAADKQPVEVSRHLRQLAKIQIDAIRKFGGQVDKLMGDGAMAYWFTDTAERERTEPMSVMKCAMQIVRESGSYFSAHGLGLAMRIGLHSGDVSFGDFGADNRIAVTVLGAAVNIAARYEQAKSADLGEIRISPELRALMIRSGVSPDTFRGPTKVEVKHGVELDVYSI
jgi:class 3 adenylate cyclase